MKNALKGFLRINHNGVEIYVNPLCIETYQARQTHDNSSVDEMLIVMGSGQVFVVSEKDFDPEGWEKKEEAKLVAQREAEKAAEKARREQEAKDLAEIERVAKEKNAAEHGGDEATQPKRGGKARVK